MINPQAYYDLGYALGTLLHEQSWSDLQKTVSQEIIRAAIPMTMQIHYRDGVSAGYKAARDAKKPDES